MLTLNLTDPPAHFDALDKALTDVERELRELLEASGASTANDEDGRLRDVLLRDLPTIRAQVPQCFERVANRFTAIAGRLADVQKSSLRSATLGALAETVEEQATQIHQLNADFGKAQERVEATRELRALLAQLAEAYAELAVGLGRHATAIRDESAEAVSSAALHNVEPAVDWWRRRARECATKLGG